MRVSDWRHVASRVLFFGQDTRGCIPALERAGYLVDAQQSVAQIRPSLARNPDTDAVIMSGVWESFLDPPVSEARERTHIPFVLFAMPGEHPAPSAFDLVVPANRPPAEWLGDFDLLIRQCRDTREEARRVTAVSDRLSEQTRALMEQSQREREQSRRERDQWLREREKSRRERERSRQEIARNLAMERIWGLKDRPRVPDHVCASDLTHSPCGDRDKLSWSIILATADLNTILFMMMKEKLDESPADQIDALQTEASAVIANLESLLTQWKTHRASHRC